LQVLNFGVEVEVEGEVVTADGFEVVDFCEDVDWGFVRLVWGS